MSKYYLDPTAKFPQEVHDKIKALAAKRNSTMAETLEYVLQNHKRGRADLFRKPHVKFQSFYITEKIYELLNDCKEYYGGSYGQIIEYALENMEND